MSIAPSSHTASALPAGARLALLGWDVNIPVVAILGAVGEVLAVIFVARLLTRGGSTAATLNWVFLILAAPYLGLLLYYLLPRRITLLRLRRRSNRMSWIASNLDEVVQPQPSGPQDRLSRLLCRLDPDAVYDGNQLTLLESGQAFAERGVQAIANAKSFVHLETYIFRPDAIGLRLLELLTEAASRGLEVRLLYDSLGSWALKRRHLRPLLAAGGRAEPYAPLLWRRRPFTLNLRNHRKLLVVDGNVAILGGRNIGDEYATDHFGDVGRWLDTMVEIRGPAVPRLHRVFVEDWYNAAEEDLAAERYFPPMPPVGKDRIGIVASGPDSPTDALGWTLFHLIATAKRGIDISSPYLIPDEVTLTALRVAAASGVRVRIFTNSRHVAQVVLHRAQRSYYRPLLEAGASIRETRHDYNHAKMILVDERRLLVGSPNLDVRSAQLNFEIAVIAEDAPVCRAALELFERRLAEGRPIGLKDLERRWWDPLANGICRLTSPLL